MNMLQIFTAGDKIYGYCQGYFGRDDYDNKVCVVCTPKYAIFESVETGFASVINYYESFDADVDEWKRDGESND
jgi:hypothetical protein